MGRRWLKVGVAVAGILAVSAKNPPEPRADGGDELPLISAERLGDADAPEPPANAPAVEDERYLSPAEHEALEAQGYDLAIDDRTVTQTRVQPAKSDTEPKGKWGRAMDHMGKGFVAVASVAVVVGAAIAPFFLF
jgi:hypothetical protein